MIAFAYYLLKVVLCSGLLFLYYHLALRNKLFHQWNRFYLLAAVALSLLIPFLQFNIWSADNDYSNIRFMQVLYSADNYVAEVSASRTFLSADQLFVIVYGLLSATVLVIFILALVKIYTIIRSHSVVTIDDIKFVSTEEQNAPFSFLNYVFWNRQIDLDSASGEHIFQHELVHVREKHSWDTLFLQLVLAAFWCNPFFWLIRKELKMIHEFIADKKSVGQSDAHAFATMILHTVYPQHYTHLTNQFFHQSIKRRLTMLTKNNNPKLSYFSRVLALPLIAVLVLAFTIKQKNITANDLNNINLPIVLDTLAVKQPTAFRAYRDKSIRWVYTDSVGKKISWNDAEKMGFNANEAEFEKSFDGSNKPYIESTFKFATPKILPDTLIDDNPLIVVDGKEIGKFRSMKNEVILSPERISSMNVLKGESAIAKYGQKGKDGVIEITTKKLSSTETLREVTITKPANAETLMGKITPQKDKPLIIIDGNESNDELNKLPPENIYSITVLKGATATSTYGPKAAEGAIIITTKDGNNSKTKEIVVEGVKMRLSEKNESQNNLKEVVVVGYGKKNDENGVFSKVEEAAEFPGGITAWRRYLEKNLNAQIPANNKAPNGKYTVIVKFIVGINGEISELKAITNYGYGMEEEVIRVITKGPEWVPARQNGKDVVSWRTQPVNFVVAPR